jgi:hypothetical protein
MCACQAEDYISHLVGHEGKGSLLSILKVASLSPQQMNIHSSLSRVSVHGCGSDWLGGPLSRRPRAGPRTCMQAWTAADTSTTTSFTCSQYTLCSRRRGSRPRRARALPPWGLSFNTSKCCRHVLTLVLLDGEAAMCVCVCFVGFCMCAMDLSRDGSVCACCGRDCICCG